MAGTKCADIIGGIAPSVRDILITEVTAGQILAIGERPQVRFDELIPMQDAHDRYAHLLGVRVEFTAHVDTNSTNMTAAASGRLFLATMANIQMSAGGRNLFRGTFDARRLDDDMFIEGGAVPYPLPNDLPDANGTDVTRVVAVEYLFGHARTERWRRDLREGGIPLSQLQSRSKATDILQWQWSNAWLPAGVTGLTITSFRVWATVGYWEQPTFEPLAFLDEVVELDGQLTIEREYRDMPGVLAYAFIRPVESDPDVLDTSEYDQITVRCGGDTLCSGESAAERKTSWLHILDATGLGHARPVDGTGAMVDAFSSGSGLGFGNLPVPLMFAPLSSKRSDMGDGPVLIDVAVLGTQARLRVLFKSYTEPPEAWKAQALKRFGIDVSSPAVRESLEMVAAKTTPTRSTTDIAPGLIEQRVEVKPK